MKRKIINTHLTLEARIHIEARLNEGVSVTNIAKELNRDRSNISREIIKHKSPLFPSTCGGQHPCIIHDKCSVKSYECYRYCKKIEVNPCKKLTSSPHVCNGCDTKIGCRHVKVYYKAKEANNEYLTLLCTSRNKLHYSQQELEILNNDFFNLVINTKSVYHSLIVINKAGYNFKLKSIYRQIKCGYLRLKPNDLPRQRKPQKSTPDRTYKKCIDGCTYEDYIKYKDSYPLAIEMQMDTVEGTKDLNAPVFLTLEIVKIKFIFIFKISKQNSENVNKMLTYFKDILGDKCFEKLFYILLTDNGKEFIDTKGLKAISNKMNLFYCHPYSSYEKGAIENNHEFIRRVIPKGVSLKCYTQEEINLLCSHANSLYRNELDGKCPFDLVEEYISLDILKKLGLQKINEKDVMLIPELLGQKNINNIQKYLDENDLKKANIKFKK